MPTPPNQKPVAPALSNDEPDDTQAGDAAAQDRPESISEVSKRLSLLGKLIIPPAPH